MKQYTRQQLDALSQRRERKTFENTALAFGNATAVLDSKAVASLAFVKDNPGLTDGQALTCYSTFAG